MKIAIARTVLLSLLVAMVLLTGFQMVLLQQSARAVQSVVMPQTTSHVFNFIAAGTIRTFVYYPLGTPPGAEGGPFTIEIACVNLANTLRGTASLVGSEFTATVSSGAAIVTDNINGPARVARVFWSDIDGVFNTVAGIDLNLGLTGNQGAILRNDNDLLNNNQFQLLNTFGSTINCAVLIIQ